MARTATTRVVIHRSPELKPPRGTALRGWKRCPLRHVVFLTAANSCTAPMVFAAQAPFPSGPVRHVRGLRTHMRNPGISATRLLALELTGQVTGGVGEPLSGRRSYDGAARLEVASENGGRLASNTPE